MINTSYRSWRIRKSNGKFRIISEPSSSLKAEQHSILESLSVFSFHDSVHGFVNGRSPLTNAQPHLEQRYVLNVDIARFFPSVAADKLLSKLEDIFPLFLVERIKAFCFLDGALPQGAPTSPVLANFFLAGVDDQIHSYATQNSLVYTRYADDITLSSNCDFLKTNKNSVITFIRSLLFPLGLLLNPKKIKLMPYYQRQLVTGILVNNAKPALPRRVKEQLYLNLKGKEFKSLTDSELGQLYFVRSISFESYLKILRGILDVPDERYIPRGD